MGFGRALTIGLAAALIALILADPRLAAEPASRGEGRIAFTFGESGADHPHQLAVMDADGKNRRVLPLWGIYGWSMSRSGRFIAYQAVDLMTMNVDGRPRYRRVIRNVGTGFNLDWSWNTRREEADVRTAARPGGRPMDRRRRHEEGATTRSQWLLL
jgi:hypothetical protein